MGRPKALVLNSPTVLKPPITDTYKGIKIVAAIKNKNKYI
jgi:hypothetical protein